MQLDNITVTEVIVPNISTPFETNLLQLNQITPGQKIYSITDNTLFEWTVYTVSVSCVKRSFQLLRYENHVFKESIIILDTRLGIDFFSSKDEALQAIEKNLLKY